MTKQCRLLLTSADTTLIRCILELPVTKGWVPKFLVVQGKLYQNTGGGLTAYFYHEVKDSYHQHVGGIVDIPRKEFNSYPESVVPLQ